ncbi:MATE efflux family protein [Neoconidiobolus thromboides FSU 785]|nr:MATE efflux family protein [Neoconidiobolus thromboides FSU 785]
MDKKSDSFNTIEEGTSENSLLAIVNELIYLITSAIPIILSTFIQFSIPTINLYSMSQYGAIEISAVALGATLANTTGNSISLGMATALDTLCSQAFTGASDKKQVGVHLQRGIVIQMMMTIPIFTVWWFSESLLLFLQQTPEVAKLSSIYLRIMILGFPPYILFECLKKYLQAQKIMRAQTWVFLLTVPITIIVNYFLMWHPTTSIGFIGAPFTIVFSNWITFLSMMIYIYYVEGLECWGGWTKDCLTNFSIYINLGLNGILMLCSEWWAWSLISLTVSYLGEDSLAAHFIALNIDSMLYAYSLSIGIVASNRIGNLLGAHHVNRAKLTSSCSILLSVTVPIFNSLFLFTFRHQFASLFTNVKELKDILIVLIPFTCVYHVFDSVACCCSGILRGQGRQKIGGIVNLLSWYCVAIPISIVLAFYLKYGLFGMWYGICIALFGTSFALFYFVMFSNWDQLFADAKKRLELCEN